jgi:hypothetical protein
MDCSSEIAKIRRASRLIKTQDRQGDIERSSQSDGRDKDYDDRQCDYC